MRKAKDSSTFPSEVFQKSQIPAIARGEQSDGISAESREVKRPHISHSP